MFGDSKQTISSQKIYVTDDYCFAQSSYSAATLENCMHRKSSTILPAEPRDPQGVQKYKILRATEHGPENGIGGVILIIWYGALRNSIQKPIPQP